ncbi:MAG TPA: hypothetical protein VF423_14635 [Actinomycetes bacterium]
MPDRITETLTALRADSDTVGLADSGAVRRRGQQRTRNQVVGSTLAVMALVAGAVGVTGSLSGGSDRSIEGPPATQGPSVTAAPEPGPTTMNPPVVDVPDSALMTVEDLGVSGLRPVQGGTGIGTLNPCLLGSDDLVNGAASTFGTSRNAISASHMALTQENADGATNQLAYFDESLAGCEDRQGPPIPGLAVTAYPAAQLESTQARLLDALGPGAYLYEVVTDDGAAWVLGTRTANAGGYFAFATDVFSIDQALAASVSARERMVDTYGA